MSSNYESNRHLVKQRLHARYQDAAQHRLARQAAQTMPETRYDVTEGNPRRPGFTTDSVIIRWLGAVRLLLGRLVRRPGAID